MSSWCDWYNTEQHEKVETKETEEWNILKNVKSGIQKGEKFQIKNR